MVSVAAVVMAFPLASERAHEDTSPAKIDVTSKSPVGDISVVTLIRTDTTLDRYALGCKLPGLVCKWQLHCMQHIESFAIWRLQECPSKVR